MFLLDGLGIGRFLIVLEQTQRLSYWVRNSRLTKQIQRTWLNSTFNVLFLVIKHPLITSVYQRRSIGRSPVVGLKIKGDKFAVYEQQVTIYVSCFQLKSIDLDKDI